MDQIVANPDFMRKMVIFSTLVGTMLISIEHEVSHN